MLRYFLEIGSLKFATYGLMLVLSFWVGGYLAVRRGRSVGFPEDWTIFVSVGMMIAGILGSRLLYLLSNRAQDFFSQPKIYFNFSDGGLSFSGGYLLAIAFGYWRSHIREFSFWTLMDVVMPSVCLGLCLTKLGCFFAGCCYGKSCTLSWAVTYSEVHTVAPKFVPIHPVQLYESLMALGVFLMLRRIWKRRQFEGQVFLSFLILFGFGRVALEFFRASEIRHSFGLSTPQTVLLSLAMVALVLWKSRSKKRICP